MSSKSKYATIPRVKTADHQVQKFINAVTTNMNRMTGTSPDSVLTRRAQDQLTNQIRTVRNQLNELGASVGFENAEFPQMPTGFEAKAGLSHVLFIWDQPGYHGHGYTMLLFNQDDLLAEAKVVATASVPSLSYPVPMNQKGYYWVRHVNKAGQIGPPQSTAGLYVETAQSPAELLAILSEEIANDTFLSEQVLTRIELLDTTKIGEQYGLVNATKALQLADQQKAEQLSLLSTSLSDATANADAARAALGLRIDGIGETLATARSELNDKITGVDAALASARGALDNKIDSAVTAAQNARAVIDAKVASLDNVLNDADAGLVVAQSQLDASLSALDNYIKGAGGVDARVLDIKQVNESLAVSVTGLQTTQGALSSRTATLEQVTADSATRFTTLETKQGDLLSRMMTQESVTTTQAESIRLLGVKDGELAAHITTVETATVDTARRVSDLSVAQTGLFSRLTTVEEVTAGTVSKVAALEVARDDLLARMITRETVSEDQAESLRLLGVKDEEMSAQIVTIETATATNTSRLASLEFQYTWASSRITSLEEASAGFATKVTELEVASDDLLARMVTQETVTTTQAESIRLLGVKDGELAGQIATVETATIDTAKRVSDLSVVQTGLSSRLTTVEDITAGTATKVTALEVARDDLVARMVTQETVTTTQAESIRLLGVKDGELAGQIATVETATIDTAKRVSDLSVVQTGLSSRLTTVEDITAGTATKVTALEVARDDLVARMVTQETVTTTQAESIRLLGVKDGELSTQIATVETATTEQAQRLSDMSVVQAGVLSRLTSVETVNAQYASRFNVLETQNDEYGSAIASLQQTTDTSAQDITQLKATSQAHSSEINSIKNVNATQASTLTQLISTKDNHAAEISALQQTTATTASLTQSLRYSNSHSASKQVLLKAADFSTHVTGEFIPASNNQMDTQAGIKCVGTKWQYARNVLRINPERTYKIRFKVKQLVDSSNGVAQIYAGVVPLTEQYMVAPVPSGGAGTFLYCAALAVQLTAADGWQVFEGIISGVGLTHNNFRPDTAYVRPMFIVNYQSAGVPETLVESLEIWDATEELALDGKIDARYDSLKQVSDTTVAAVERLRLDTDTNLSLIQTQQQVTNGYATRLSTLETSASDYASRIVTLESASANSVESITQLSLKLTGVDNVAASIVAAEDRVRVYADDIRGALTAERVIKVDANGVVAGAGFLADSQNGSRIYLSADKVSIVPPGWDPSNASQALLPFVYSAAHNRIIINQASIVDLTADKIVGGSLVADDLTATKGFHIPPGAIKRWMLDVDFTDGLVRTNPDGETTGGPTQHSGTYQANPEYIRAVTYQSAGNKVALDVSFVSPKIRTNRQLKIGFVMWVRKWNPDGWTVDWTKQAVIDSAKNLTLLDQGQIGDITYVRSESAGDGYQKFGDAFDFIWNENRENEWYQFIVAIQTVDGSSAEYHTVTYGISSDEPKKSTGGIVTDIHWRNVIGAPALAVKNEANVFTASQIMPNLYLNAGGAIYSKYNNAPVFKDHANGNVTISAAGADLYLGYQNTTMVRLHAKLTTDDGTSVIDTNGTLYYQGQHTDERYARKAAANTYAGIQTFNADIKMASGQKIHQLGAWHTLTTPGGYIQFGPANPLHAHIYTDRPNFYFNKELMVLGHTVWHSGNDADLAKIDRTNVFEHKQTIKQQASIGLDTTRISQGATLLIENGTELLGINSNEIVSNASELYFMAKQRLQFKSQAVFSEYAVFSSNVGINGNLTVGDNGNGILHTRHIDGTRHDSNEADTLYLNYSNGKPVSINGYEAWHQGNDSVLAKRNDYNVFSKDQTLSGVSLYVSRPVTTGGYARGVMFTSPGGAREAGVGVYGDGDRSPGLIFLGFGSSPWEVTRGLVVRDVNDGLYFRDNKVYHANNDGVGSGLDADFWRGFGPEHFVPAQSSRDFTLGTLVKTDINYAVTHGDPWYMEITGNAYGGGRPFLTQVQGYIYNDTLVNVSGTHHGQQIEGIVAFAYEGNLCFWWPRQSYWQGFNVVVKRAHQGTFANRVVAIQNIGKPTDVIKEIGISDKIALAWNSFNDGTGSGLDADLLRGLYPGYSGSNVILRTASNGYLKLNNWIEFKQGTGLYYPDVTGVAGNTPHLFVSNDTHVVRGLNLNVEHGAMQLAGTDIKSIFGQLRGDNTWSGVNQFNNEVRTVNGHAVLNGLDTWLRSANNDGWLNQKWGGGIHMTDASWVRIYGDKQFYVSNASASAIHTLGGVDAHGRLKSKAYVHLDSASGEGGLVGSYGTRPTEPQMIWTIGDSWKTHATHYGLGYRFGGVDGVSASSQHMLILASNGTVNTKLSLTGHAWFKGGVNANVLYENSISIADKYLSVNDLAYNSPATWSAAWKSVDEFKQWLQSGNSDTSLYETVTDSIATGFVNTTFLQANLLAAQGGNFNYLTTRALEVTGRRALVNNFTATGNFDGWKAEADSVNADRFAFGTAVTNIAQLSELAMESFNLNGSSTDVLKLTNSGNVGYASHGIEVNHDAIYEFSVTFIVPAGSAGSRYFGVIASANDANGPIQVNASEQYNRFLQHTLTGNNAYFWSGGDTGTLTLRGYVVGANRSIEEVPENTLNLVKVKPNTKSLYLRFLNWSNGSTSSTLRVFNPSVREIKTGKIVAHNIVSNAVQAQHIEANSATMNKLRAAFGQFAKLNADQIDVDLALINTLKAGFGQFGKLTASEIEVDLALINTLKAGLGQFGKLTASEIEVDQALINNLKAGFGQFGKLTASEIEVDQALINNLKAGFGQFGKLTASEIEVDLALINNLKAGLGQFGKLTSEHIAAGQIDTHHLKVTARELGNNFSTSNSLEGYSNTSDDRLELVSKGTEMVRALKISTSGNRETTGPWFDVDPNAIYEFSISIHSKHANDIGTRYFGLNAVDESGNVVPLAKYNYSGHRTLADSEETNPYFWHGNVYAGQWTTVTGYLVGANRSINEIPGKAGENPAFFVFRMPHSGARARMRFLNYYNQGQTVSNWFYSPTVTRLGGGLVEAPNIKAGAVEAEHLKVNQAFIDVLKGGLANFGKVTSRELLVDTALIQNLQLGFGQFGKLTGEHIDVASVDVEQLRWGKGSFNSVPIVINNDTGNATYTGYLAIEPDDYYSAGMVIQPKGNARNGLIISNLNGGNVGLNIVTRGASDYGLYIGPAGAGSSSLNAMVCRGRAWIDGSLVVSDISQAGGIPDRLANRLYKTDFMDDVSIDGKLAVSIAEVNTIKKQAGSSNIYMNDPVVFIERIQASTDVEIDNASKWFVSSADRAHQRCDARDYGGESKLYWYGVNTQGAEKSARHMYYTGSRYIAMEFFENHCFFGDPNFSTGSPYHLQVIDGKVYATEFVTISDRNTKTNIARLTDPLGKLNKLSGYTFINQSGEYAAGTMAQELQAVLPETISTNARGHLAISQGPVNAILIESTKALHKSHLSLIDSHTTLQKHCEQQAVLLHQVGSENKALQQKNQKLHNDIQTLEARVARLEQLLMAA
ncbi:tail fiber domain-containing protein [Pseudoalteromonas rubra]|uniref:tail fiber domain-containing protein n=1 Tax=Pseudoalteromonas rubra TaxID=43658 RepID=UPI002DB63FAA|nr:tail fiber domain-containing protein [Pseudoalteromonas rubra]MEC4091582.1 tail fiber domain-containing protein [Pseudoalteromonas rubra]